jgi:electron transport complex protein RnfC
VGPGDAVKVGTKIAEADGAVSAAVHSSVSGTVRAIGPFPYPCGGLAPAIEIANDGRDEQADSGRRQDISDAPPDTVREAVREAGIVGLGGGGFPTHVKLCPAPGTRLDLVILNGAECEPYLTGDHRTMLERTEEVVAGLRTMMRVLDCERGVIAVERDKPDAIGALKRAAKPDKRLAVAGLKTKYPQGSEIHLVKALTGREVARGGIPPDAGCLVHNVGTAVAVWDALVQGRPLITRVITVAGSAAKAAGNFRVPIGSLLGDVISFAGGARDCCCRVVAGGPMTGVAQATLQVPVIKTTTGIILMGPGDIDDREPGPCIRCGRCVDACPMRLMPHDLGRFIEEGRIDLAETYGIEDCIECGVCAYLCPAKINLVYLMRRGKSLLAAGRQGH